MVGRSLDNLFPKEFGVKGEVALKAEHLEEGGVLHDVSFEAYRGQCWLRGPGRRRPHRDHARDLRRGPLDGKIYIDGKKSRSRTRPGHQGRHRVLTEDRKGQGLVLRSPSATT